MANGLPEKIITAIDIGTTKICVLIARQLDDQNVEIIGIGKAPSHGLSKGVVVDVAKTIYSIRTAIKEAELMANMPIETVTIGISGGHIQSLNSQGVVPIKHREIKEQDIAAVLAAAKAVLVPDGQQILHILPQYYVIDGRDKVIDPLGMHGIRLEVQAHIIMGAIASVQNLIKCCEAAGVMVSDIVLEQLASAHAVLSEDELKLGVAMLDIGGGTADLAVYQHGSIRHVKVFPVAGNHFTNDLAVGLCTTIKDAERIKKEYGIIDNGIIKDDLIEIDMVQGGQKQLVKVADLARILEPRTNELLSLVKKEIQARHLASYITTGIVLTGGGSLLHGMQNAAEKVFKGPVRIGHPKVPFSILQTLQSPIYATSYGLLLHTMKKHKQDLMSNLSGPLIKRVLYRMRTWMIDFF
jgi:cell division protein FtsA